MNKSDLNDISVTTFDAARERNCVASLPANVQDSPAKSVLMNFVCDCMDFSVVCIQTEPSVVCKTRGVS